MNSPMYSPKFFILALATLATLISAAGPSCFHKVEDLYFNLCPFQKYLFCLWLPNNILAQSLGLIMALIISLPLTLLSVLSSQILQLVKVQIIRQLAGSRSLLMKENASLLSGNLHSI